MGIRAKFDMLSELVKPKLEDLNVTSITADDMIPVSSLSKKSGVLSTDSSSQPSAAQTSATGYYWQSWSMNLSLSNQATMAKNITDFLKFLNKTTKVITQILKVLRLLSGDVKSIAMFLKVLIKTIAKALKNFLDSLASTGIYMSVISPNFDKKFPRYTVPVYGGYREFITRVVATCSSSTDPDAPKFNNADDKVGGVIIAMLGGTQDPNFLKDVIDNFRKLSQFFGFQNPMPTAPKNFRVISGRFRDPKDGTEKMGVQLTWEPADTPVTHFKVYKSDTGVAVSKTIKQDGVESSISVVGTPIADIPGNFDKPFCRYTDFDVKEGTRYSYKVYSVIGTDFFDSYPTLEDVKSPIATALVPVSPRNCIPVSELKKYTTLSISGELLSPFDFEGDWQSITVRRMFGKALDGAFTQIDALADKLIGLVNTGSKATTDYLDFYAKRVQKLLDTVTKFQILLQRLLAFNLRGTFMVLRLDIKDGGMPGFLQRFNQATTIDNTKIQKTGTLADVAKKVGGQIDVNDGIAKYTDRGIMLGIILLYGLPGMDNSRLLQIVNPNEVDSLKKKLKNTEQAITTLMKMLGLG